MMKQEAILYKKESLACTYALELTKELGEQDVYLGISAPLRRCETKPT